MKFKKGSVILLSLLALVGIASCGGTPSVNPSEKPSETPTVTPSVTPTETPTVTPTEKPTEKPAEGKTNEDFERAKTTFTKTVGDQTIEGHLNRNTLYTNSGAPHLDSMESSNILVIPFGFNNPKYDESAERIKQIETVFFGSNEEIAAKGGWRSVKEFYNQSSFGKGGETGLFDGKVAQSWCMWDQSEEALLQQGGGRKAAEYGAKWYKTEYAKEGHGALGPDAEPISYFDKNKDGFIDLTWIVYSRPTGSVNDYWAYVTYTGNQPSKDPTSPNVQTLGFASIDWMDKKFGGYDAHTYIHETGHTFGLDDYYDYNDAWSPFGKIDMMDGNIGDHSAYSKFSLGWVNPWIVDDSATITLRSTTLSGDCFVLPSPGYNKTAFDEYIMVEFMTPEGLSEQDYINGYESKNGFNEPGIRVSHVDARVYNNQSTRDSYLIDNPEDGLGLRIGNTRGGRMGIKQDGDYWPEAQHSAKGKFMSHLSLIEASFDKDDNPLTTSKYIATNNSLFKKGQRLSFTSGGWAETFMPSGTNLWNKAKTITDWKGLTQGYTIDETCTIDYSLRVKNIEKVDGEYIATISVTKKSK